MGNLTVRLIVLIAVLLMPLGMAPAHANADADHASAGMTMQHCPKQDRKAGVAECTMACSTALPAIEASREPMLTVRPSIALPRVEQELHGLHPETATPPPRLA